MAAGEPPAGNSETDTRPARVRDSRRTREVILREGRRQFAARGYSGTTVKTVAEAAEVSPNLITRYFGGKDGLFIAATQTSLHLDQVLAGPRESFGDRLATSIVTRWRRIDGQDPLLILQRAAGDRPSAATALVTFLDRESLGPLTDQLYSYGLAPIDAAQRAAGIEALVMGVVTRRRVLTSTITDPLALIKWLATTVQRLIDAP